MCNPHSHRHKRRDPICRLFLHKPPPDTVTGKGIYLLVVRVSEEDSSYLCRKVTDFSFPVPFVRNKGMKPLRERQILSPQDTGKNSLLLSKEERKKRAPYLWGRSRKSPRAQMFTGLQLRRGRISNKASSPGLRDKGLERLKLDQKTQEHCHSPQPGSQEQPRKQEHLITGGENTEKNPPRSTGKNGKD